MHGKASCIDAADCAIGGRFCGRRDTRLHHGEAPIVPIEFIKAIKQANKHR